MNEASSPPPGAVRLAAVQMAPRIGAVEENVGATLEALEQAAGLGAGLVAYPECSLTGYCFRDRDEAWGSALGRDHSALERIARAAAARGVHAVVGYLERVGDRLANAASVLGRGGVIAHYRKAHLPYLGVDRWVEPGCDPFAVHEVGGLRVGLLICYDASFPEAARLLALAGADLVLLPTNWPEEAVAKADWLPNTRAYENVIYFAAVNRVGEERGYRFHGRSRICGPAGETLAQGPDDAGAILLADIDPRRSRQKKIVRREGEYWVDRIGQRRTDLYRLAGEGPPEGGRASRPEAADPPDRHPGGPDAARPDLPREPAA